MHKRILREFSLADRSDCMPLSEQEAEARAASVARIGRARGARLAMIILGEFT